MNMLERYGATERFLIEATLYPEYFLGRIISQYKDIYKVATEDGEFLAVVSGKFRYEAKCLEVFPVVGDFVMIDRKNDKNGKLVIHKVLTRKSMIERTAVGVSNQVQLIATNIDFIFICMSCNNDYNLRRLERYLSVAWSSGATPVVILTKSDLCSNISEISQEVSSIAIGTDILFTSSYDEKSYQQLFCYIKNGVTASFIGSSGVGKSTLINCLLGENYLATSELRNDDKGRHTTTRRELFVLSQGGVVIDTPGMRELGVESVNLSKSFEDIDLLVTQCKFKDCSHTNEPGCAIRKAIESGKLDEKRFENYEKLKKEASYEGLTSKQIETKKFNDMFHEVGGMKKVRNFIRKNNKRN